MTRLSRVVHNVLSHRVTAILGIFGSIASIVSLAWMFFLDVKSPAWKIGLVLALCVGVTIFLAASIYSIRVRQENICFRHFIKKLHRINHAYRDVLGGIFKSDSQIELDDRLLGLMKENEQKTILSVCQKIAQVYSSLTHSECMVTVKLITAKGGRNYCETYVRSEDNCGRDLGHSSQFAVGTGENTAFDLALLYRAGTISRYYSADLKRDSTYRNQRDNWKTFYRSVIVVPIRYVNPVNIGERNSSDDIGFLCVDTLSPNRLNDTWHVDLLASFADQMYNFMSLMRGKYRLRHE